MNARECWNFIVDKYERLHGEAEIVIQKEWEDYFSELFDYKKILKEIDPQRSIQIGSYERTRPDIILRKNGVDLFAVELKQYSLPFDEKREAQIVSYLNLLRLPIGVLVCQKIYLFYWDDAEQKWNHKSIPFLKDCEDGIRFVELFKKENYSAEKVAAFIKEKLESERNVETIRSEITMEGFVEEIVSDYYASQNYTEEEIRKALRGYSIKIEKRREPNAPLPPSYPSERLFDRMAKRAPFTFKSVGVPVGAELEYIGDPKVKVVVADEKSLVIYNGRNRKLSSVSMELKGGKATQGCAYFTYRGVKLKKLYDELDRQN